MKRKILVLPIVLSLLAFANQACTRVLAIASDHPTRAVAKRYTGTPDLLYSQSVRVLENMGYEMPTADPYQYQIQTGWKPVTSGSHYFELFNRRDYSAASGAYYQLAMNFYPEGAYTRVEVKTVVKSIAGKLTSSRALEKGVLKRLDDVMRSPQIQITNVGVSNR